MLEKTGAMDVYFEDAIEILSSGDSLTVASIIEVLTEKEIEFTKVEESSSF